MTTKKLLIISLLIISLPTLSSAREKPSDEKIGDSLAIALPALAYGLTFQKKDKEGRSQYYRSFVATTAANAVLKLSGIGKRPEDVNEKTDSFPSGHTAYAFQGATFMHKRYGLKYGIPAYVAATFVASSRRDRHHDIDVIAGVALGVASSWYYTKKKSPMKKKSSISPVIGKDTVGLSYSKVW